MSGAIRRNSREQGEESVRAALLSARDQDLGVRAELVASGTLWDAYHPRMEEVHLRNASLLAGILEDHGWPDSDRFGPDGESAAWMILMHSISVPVLMRRGLELLADAVKRGDTAPARLARLEDRILTLEGRPQVYGTIFDWDDEGRMSPLPIGDPETVDDRRDGVGLPPLSEDVRRLREEAATTRFRPPSDPDSKAKDYEIWLKRTGWR